MDVPEITGRLDSFLKAVADAAEAHKVAGFTVLAVADAESIPTGSVEESPKSNTALPVAVGMRCKSDMSPMVKVMLHMAKEEIHNTVRTVVQIAGGMEKDIPAPDAAAKPNSQQG